ncbi:MAG: efflux RND transporter periplasmic adaptor subunit [Bacteroidota bacterium]|nr:efflux RND transporter periplasmic adaptor subunit [Bacteroidota bacterium]MDP4212634.1 efflux RND transporter periplasmic adaptor subunit [Bacteroidota bacterium]MDP4251590.1 efflux RND transporter periplasmic adaptor subunit [Bacteroidota bacterium]
MKNNLYRIGKLATLAALLTACGSNKDQSKLQGHPTSVAVNTYVVQPGNATYFDIYPATVTPLNQVDIKPQISGNIVNIYFKDGQYVRKGQKLYEIDQQQYRAAYEQAVANLNVSKANLAKSQQDADRYTELSRQDAIAKQTLDHQLADLESSKRQVQAAEANVQSVETNLKYSSISAPFDGTIGISNVKIGTAVYPQTLLNSISSDNPVAVDISVNQSEIPLFTGYLQKAPASKDSIFTVLMTDGSVYPFPGQLYLLDRAVDPQTGTIKARLIFPNGKNELKPGITTNVRIKHGSGDSSLLIPYKSVVEQLGEYFVYTVNESKAVQRKVSLGARIDDKIVVKSGLQAGDSVVTEGVQKLKDSTLVKTALPATPAAK